jgi:predicted transport protein
MKLTQLVNATQATLNSESNYVANSNSSDNKYKSVSDYLKDLDGKTAERYQHLKDYIMTLGDDVFEKETKYYIAFKKIKNFVTVTFAPREGLIYFYLKLDPNEYINHINQYPEMIRNVKDIGHWGTGDIEVKVRSDKDLDVAKQLILESYEMN